MESAAAPLVVLRFDPQKPAQQLPLCSLLTAYIINAETRPTAVQILAEPVSLRPATLQTPEDSAKSAAAMAGGEKLKSPGAAAIVDGGDLDAAKRLAELFHDSVGLAAYATTLGADAASESNNVSLWIEVAQFLAKGKAGASVPVSLALLADINQYLKTRTFLCGHQVTLADVAMFVSLLKHAELDVQAALQLVKTAPSVTRWLSYMSELRTTEAVLELRKESRAAVGASGIDKVSKTKQDNGPSLPGAVKGKVVTRFPPEPSGYLHIGHAKAALLNHYFAKLYDGKLLLRFDDTNPRKEKEEFEQSIIEDLELLNIKGDSITRTSDYFPLFEEKIVELMKKGKAYVDDTPVERMREERGAGVESKNRNLTFEENLKLWEEMKKGTDIGVTCCVRAKIDMKSPNKCMRDPVMYRCIVDTPHHKHGYKYKVYPTYDFACPIVDSAEGVTHAMRTNEYADRIPQYFWVMDALELPRLVIYEFSRLNFVNTVLSKRKLQWFVDNHHVESWEDPRFPTVRGIRRRGLTVEALLKFALEQGPSKNTNLMEWDKLWAINKQVIDPIAPRFSAVGVDSVPVSIEGGPETPEFIERPLHPKNASVGTTKQARYKCVRLEMEDAAGATEGEKITLMRWGNMEVTDVVKDGETVTKIALRPKLDDTDVKSTRKLHWIAVDEEKVGLSEIAPCKCTLREFDHLITKKKPEDDDAVEDLVNANSVMDTEALAESVVGTLPEGTILQLERRGYFRVDRAKGPSGEPVLIKIPDGKTKTMSVISTKVDVQKLAKGS